MNTQNCAYAENQNSGLSLADIAAFDPRHVRREGECDACCPLCGLAKRVDAAHRSLSYNAQTGLWRCARCAAKGILTEFRPERVGGSPRPLGSRRGPARLRRRMQLPPVVPEPVSAVPEAWRVRIGALTPLVGTRGGDYVQSVRALPATLCHAGGVRFAQDFFGRPAIAFPLRNGDRELVAAQGRYIDGRDNPRMRTAGPRKLGLFATLGAYAVSVTGRIVVTEAPLDALTLALCGVPAVALCGCEGVPEWFVRRAAFQTVYAAFDADEAGDRAAVQFAERLTPVGARVLRLRPESGLKDWNAALGARGPAALRGTLADLLAAPPFFDPDWTAALRAAVGRHGLADTALAAAGFGGCAELAGGLTWSNKGFSEVFQTDD